MTESLALLHAATALLLLALLLHILGGVTPRRRAALLQMSAGALVPLLDYALFYFMVADRIELLSRRPVFHGLYAGSLLIGGLGMVAALVAGTATGRRLLVYMGAGFLLHLGCAVLTPTGVALLAPFSSRIVSLPLFPEGHPLLIGGLVVFLFALETLPRARRWWLRMAVGFVALYALAGAGQYLVFRYRVQELKPPGGAVSVAPAHPWLVQWQVAITDGAEYRVGRLRLDRPEVPELEVVPRWNNQPMLLTMLADPIVAQFYFAVFRNPVVRLEALGSQIALTMQELRDQVPLVPGARFYIEADLNSRDRYYQLQRLD